MPVDITNKWDEYVAGAGAGICNVAITFPIHKLMFRQMLHGVSTRNAAAELWKEGFRLLYRGTLPPLCQKAVSTSIMFGSYKTYSQFLMTQFPNGNTQVLKSTGAAFAGLTEALLTPFERVQTLLQDKHYNSKLKSSPHAIGHIWKNFGFFEFYRGFSIIIFRNALSNILFFAAKEKVESTLPKPKTYWGKITSDFISGGGIGAALSTMYYPLNVIKAHTQCQLGGPFVSPRSVFQTVFTERGRKFSEMFRGVHLNYTRAALSWGIINLTYEMFLARIQKMQGKNS